MGREGEIAVVHFTGRVAEGEDAGAVFDTTQAAVAVEAGIYDENRDYEPLSFRVGSGEVIPGLDEAVREMSVGDRRTVRLAPERAFGERRDDRVVELPREEVEPRGGGSVERALVRTDDGRTGWVVDSEDDAVTVDFNHELAGREIELDVEVVDASGRRSRSDRPDHGDHSDRPDHPDHPERRERPERREHPEQDE